MIMSGLHFMGEVAVHPDLSARHRARHPAPQDVEVAGQRDRSARGGGALRRRRAALLAGLGHVGGHRRHPRSRATSRSSFAPAATSPTSCGTPGRFILSNLEGPPGRSPGARTAVVRREELTLADRWIIARCDATVREATEAYERFRLNEAAAAVYRFIWSDLADWYIEQIKPRLYGEQPGGDVARAVVGADLRRGAPAAPPGHAVHHRGAVAALPRPAGGRVDLGRALAPARPAGGGCRGAARVRAGAGAGRRHPRHSRGVRRAARARRCAPW